MSFGYALVDVDGASHALDGSLGVFVRRGARGLGMPAVTVNSDKFPYAPGGARRRIATPTVKVDVPLRIEAATASLLDALMDTVRGWVLPGTERNELPSTVKLQVTRADGAVRQLEGVYAGGLDGDDSAGWTTWQLAMLTLDCPDPYWRDTSDTTHIFTSGAGFRSWWPYWPYDLMPSAVYAIEAIANGGQVETWPVWTITGPGTIPILTNLTTGDVLDLSASGGLTLAAGDVVTIDTSEGVKTILNQSGVNLWPYATTTSEMWPLAKGSNSIQVAMTSTTVASAVRLAYRRRWAGGHR